MASQSQPPAATTTSSITGSSILSGTSSTHGPLNRFFSKSCFFPAENFGAVFELSLPILYPLPSLMLRRAVPSKYHGVFPRPETTAPTHTPEVIPWVACFLLGGLLKS